MGTRRKVCGTRSRSRKRVTVPIGGIELGTVVRVAGNYRLTVDIDSFVFLNGHLLIEPANPYGPSREGVAGLRENSAISVLSAVAGTKGTLTIERVE